MLRRTIASGRSCLECSRRKIKCDRSLPCSYCVKIKAACVYPPKRRQSRSPDSGSVSVTSRLDNIEDTLRVLSEDLGQIRNSLRHLVSFSASDATGDGEFLQTRPSLPHGKCVDTGLGSEIEAEPPIRANSALDSAKETIERQHPSPVTISILWHWYLDTVDPVLKTFHTPSVQKDILRVITEDTTVDVAKQCLLFAIYYSSVTSMSSTTCLDKLNEDRSTLLERYRNGVERALARVDLSSSLDITLLQAFTIYLTCLRLDSRGPTVKTHLSTAINMAYRMNLHRDGTTQRLSVLETETRRHLWWQLVTLDTRTAEDHNTTPYILKPSFTTQFPCIIVDAGLPSPSISNATTSCTFFQLLHYELISFTRRIIFSDTFNQANDYHILSPIHKHKAINDFRQSLETRYFSHCGSINPLEFITAATVQLFLVEMKLAVCKPGQNFRPICVEVLQRALALREHEQGQKWLWLVQRDIEWGMMELLLDDLCAEGVNEGREEAWRVVEQAYGNWEGDETEQETGKWAVIKASRTRALTVRGCASEVVVSKGLELVPDSYGPVPVEELAEGTVTGELPGDGTVCEWSMEAFEQYFLALGAGDGMSNVL
ncbi:transcription factor domain-containing protein [Aspergillus vadensis CBS 113365]|uniref:Zn(2)-C6 fungal-type domain-containing protein n=1 Tax=Aspergillus vadensis (strain CBS 113365 / IMI 142717 / IBT 24658) TaxID=1448311 RepID=A0A319AW77_ASPVC|nr:hypothetical protein BO88DRAFT_491424 [Aspergillus vadensis CBS 113365]PYH64489.1 hypothetical protein BO88DRAFT_491424 [Aspergillus vadensis CBS 113365]